MSGYHQPTEEYGTHCNAFFVLGLSGLIVGYATPISAPHAGVCGAFVLCAHEFILAAGVAAWVENAPRNTLLTSNKEGFVLLSGVVGMECLARAIAGLLPNSHSLPTSASWTIVYRLGVVDCCLWLAGAAATLMLSPPSRKLCNITFVLLSAAQIVLALTLCTLANILAPHVRMPLLFALNRNLLSVFIVANVATGLVNLALPMLGKPTSGVDSVAAVVLLVSYLFFVGSFTLWIDGCGRSRMQNDNVR